MNIGTIATVVSVILSMASAIVAIRNSHISAKKSTVDSQATIIENLQEEYARLIQENEKLREGLRTLEAQYRNVCEWAEERGYEVPTTLSND